MKVLQNAWSATATPISGSPKKDEGTPRERTASFLPLLVADGPVFRRRRCGGLGTEQRPRRADDRAYVEPTLFRVDVERRGNPCPPSTAVPAQDADVGARGHQDHFGVLDLVHRGPTDLTHGLGDQVQSFTHF